MKIIIKEVDEKTIRRIARDYLSGNFVTLKSLGTKYKTTSTTISNILWRGIAENIIDERVAKYIYTKVVDHPSIGWYQRKLRWDEAFHEREKTIQKQKEDLKKQEKLDELYTLKDYYEATISTYENFYCEDKNSPYLASLKTKLDEVLEQIAALS